MNNIKAIFLIFFISSGMVYGKGKIKGRIISNNLEILADFKIYDENSNLIGNTDFNGYFNIELKEPLEKIFFYEVGFELTKISIDNSCNYLEIIIINKGWHDNELPKKKLERIRKKRFKRLKKIRCKAFKNKLFLKKEMCHIRTFESKEPTIKNLPKIKERIIR